MIWYVFFSSFSYEVDNWGCIDYLCCLTEIFASFFGFPLGFLEDFIGNLQRYLCALFGLLDFC